MLRAPDHRWREGTAPHWRPVLPPGQRPLHAAVLAAVERDVASGLLRRGDRLPAQRDLADALGVSVGTVTKAFEKGVRTGLLASTVGRGTFVGEDPAASSASGGAPYDLAQNIVNVAGAARWLSDAMKSLAAKDLTGALAYPAPGGSEEQRRTAARWLRESASFEPDWSMLIVCSGAQHALWLTLSTLCRPGDRLLVENVTYPGLKALAAALGLTLIGVEMDGQGLLPDALDKTAGATGAGVLYTMPTLQNPTARTMGLTRRKDISAVARRLGLTLVEDDIYGALAPPAAAVLPPLASLAPERTYYIGSVSKVLAPGLKTGMAVAPSRAAAAALADRLRATSLTGASLGTIVFGQLVRSGAAAAMLEETRREVAIRVSAATQILGSALERPTLPASPHVWLPLSAMEADSLASRASARGVTVTPPSAPSVGATAGIRLCIGAPPNERSLREALIIVQSALQADRTGTAAIV